MDSRTQERVEQWDSRPFTDGYGGLTRLAESGFSGAVTAAETWLFMLNGRIIGVIDGTIEDFEHLSGTIYAAPDPAIPLLCSMRATDGTVRGRYYTNETPIEEVDGTLKKGSFTGYVELSEQVLSGDYYLVYYGGKRMAIAYIGNAGRLLTGDKAFERAADEVGIYEVVDVTIEVTDVPEPADEPDTSMEPPISEGNTGTAPSLPETSNADETSTATAKETATSMPEDTSSAEPPARLKELPTGGEEPVEDGDISALIGGTDAGELSGGFEEEAAEQPPSTTRDDSQPTNEQQASPLEASNATAQDADSAGDPHPELSRASEAGTTEALNAGSTHERSNAATDEAVASAAGESDGPDTADVDGEAVDGTSATADDGDADEHLEREEQWRETRRIPSIDPEKSASGGQDRDERSTKAAQRSGDETQHAGSNGAAGSTPDGAVAVSGGDENAKTSRSQSGHPTVSATEPSVGAESGSDEHGSEQTSQARARLDAFVETLKRERDGYRARNAELTEEIERLQAKTERLETALERERARSLEIESDEPDPAEGTAVPPDRARSGTNLFVRYDTQSESTLPIAHGGGSDRDAVAANLQLEYHTDFDAETATVDGQPYEEFLTATMEYRFVDWLTKTLLFEIRETGHGSDLADLYDAIPRIDRAELQATISLENSDPDLPNRVGFDVVAFDKRGTPVVVANFNDSREPADEEMLTTMKEAASAIKASHGDFGAAVVVTSSYFDPGALEVTEQATASGFLSRGSKQSYVTLSRKHGYHLCLVESRSGGFHLTVPEL